MVEDLNDTIQLARTCRRGAPLTKKSQAAPVSKQTSDMQAIPRLHYSHSYLGAFGTLESRAPRPACLLTGARLKRLLPKDAETRILETAVPQHDSLPDSYRI